MWVGFSQGLKKAVCVSVTRKGFWPRESSMFGWEVVLSLLCSVEELICTILQSKT